MGVQSPRQHPDPGPVDRVHQAGVAGCNGLNATHGDGHHLAARALDALLHHCQVWVFAGAGEEAAVKRLSGDGQLITGVGRRSHDAW